MPDDWRQMLTPAGEPNADYRARFSILSEGRFPVAPGDCKRAKSAMMLRGNGTTKEERAKILRVVAQRCPDLAEMVRMARMEDEKEGMM